MSEPYTSRLPDRLTPLLAVLLFVVLVHIMRGFYLGPGVLDGNLVDGDSYIHMVRISQLYLTGDWFDSSLVGSNAPFGTTLHWTRLFDLILLGLALPLVPFIGFEKALFDAGAIISPLLHIISVIALIWATRPVLGRKGAYLGGGLMAAQPSIMSSAIVGYVDHNMLFVLIAIIAFGFLARSLSGLGQRHAWAAGLAISTGLWVGVEMVVFLGVCLFLTATAWLFEDREALLRNRQLTLGFSLGVALVLLVERGVSGYLDIEYDRISIVHLSLAVLLAAFWAAVGWWQGRHHMSLMARALAGIAGAATVAAVMYVIFPKFLAGPMAIIDPAAMPYFQAVSENDTIGSIPRFLIFFGPSILALPWAIWRMREEWRGPGFWAWGLVVTALIVYLAFSVYWVRWSYYAGIFMAIIIADLILRADAFISSRLNGMAKTLTVVPVLSIIAIGPTTIGLISFLASPQPKQPVTCNIRAITDILNSPKWSGRSRIIITSANFGPQILYRTKHRVLATFHHRNGAGMVDSVKTMKADNEAEILSLIDRRLIDIILICPGSPADSYFADNASSSSLYKRLERGDLPSRIRRIKLPKTPNSGFMMFEVSR